MNWNYLNTGFRNGNFNMDFDLHLVKNCPGDEAYFRLYRWVPYCISLGANQDLRSVNAAEAEKNNIDIVKRPTGGRAVLHSEEITYSVVMPLTNTSSVKEIYFHINKALIEGLKLYNERLAETELENFQPDLKNFYKENISSVCFVVPAKSEVKFSRKKLIGSAQRKMGNTLLQHGSVLCGKFHEKIIDFLYLNETEKLSFKTELKEKTISLNEILNEEVDYEKLSLCLAEGFQKYFRTEFVNGEFSKEISL